ncbi:hypothetical protein AB0E88_19550 [Streptomyces sp. NPDC028635]
MPACSRRRRRCGRSPPRLLLQQAALNNLGAGVVLAMLPVFLLGEPGLSA